jgi:hypothetical protein
VVVARSRNTVRALVTGAERARVLGALGPALWSAIARTQVIGPVPDEVSRLGRAAFRECAPIVATAQEVLAFDAMNTDLHALRDRAAFPPIPVLILSATAGMPSAAAVRWLRCHSRLAETLRARHRILPGARHPLVWEAPGSVLDEIAGVVGELC